MNGSKGRRDSFDEMLQALGLPPGSGGKYRLDVLCEGEQSGNFPTTDETLVPLYMTNSPQDPFGDLNWVSKPETPLSAPSLSSTAKPHLALSCRSGRFPA